MLVKTESEKFGSEFQKLVYFMYVAQAKSILLIKVQSYVGIGESKKIKWIIEFLCGLLKNINWK